MTFGVHPTVELIDDYDTPLACIEASFEYRATIDQFATCVGTDATIEDFLATAILKQVSK